MAMFQRVPMDRKQLFGLMNALSTKETTETQEPIRMGRLERKSTANECFTDFVRGCLKVHQNNDQNIDGLLSVGVGLRPENRPGVFDLYWFVKQPRFCYCSDVKDPDFVCRLDLGIGKACSCCHHD